jgi:hypothetical protein
METESQAIRKDSTEQPSQENEWMDIYIIDFNGKQIPLKIVAYESVVELKEYLSEHIFTFLFTNYTLEHKGEKLSDF